MAITGFIEDYAGGARLKADISSELDMYLEAAGGGIKLRTAALDPVFPDEGDVCTRSADYGWGGEYEPDFQLMADPAGMVEDGILWGEAGTEFLGTLAAGGTAPATPVLYVVDSLDGSTATATVTGSDAGSVNRIWLRRQGGNTPILAGTRIGDGPVTVTQFAGEYLSMVTSTLRGVSSNMGNAFWISQQSVLRTTLQNGPALAHLEVCKVLGVRVDFYNNDEACQTLWAMDMSAEDSTTTIEGETAVRRMVLEVPRQTGFPVKKIKPGAYFVVPSGSLLQEDVFGIDTTMSTNDFAGINPCFKLNLRRLDYTVELGG